MAPLLLMCLQMGTKKQCFLILVLNVVALIMIMGFVLANQSTGRAISSIQSVGRTIEGDQSTEEAINSDQSAERAVNNAHSIDGATNAPIEDHVRKVLALIKSKHVTGETTNAPRKKTRPIMELIRSKKVIGAGGMNAPELDKTGFVLALDSSDQSTGGAINIMSLQCLMGQIDPRRIVVVEPFIVRGVWGAHLSGDQQEMDRENNVRLSDIYDIRNWESVASNGGYGQLAKWEDFLHHAPRDLILVDFEWQQSKCFAPELLSKVSLFSSLHNFSVAKTVCFDAAKSGALNLDQFKNQLYENFTTSSVSVIISIFGGINGSPDPFANRCIIQLGQCSRATIDNERNKLIKPSQRLLSDAQRYINEYLNHQTGYLSFMVRLEHILVRYGTNKTAVESCVTHFIEIFQKMKNLNSTNGVFFTMDVGKYGSIGIINGERGNVTVLEALMRDFFHEAYGQTLTFSEWEESFQKISGLTSGGVGPYVAGLQKVVASRGQCIILAGGGTFQETALNLYKENRKTDLCFIEINSHCNQTNIIVLP